MVAKINSQKMLKTGDTLFLKKTSRPVKIHYLIERDGQLTFDSMLDNVDEVVVVPDGIKAERFKMNQLAFNVEEIRA